MSYAIIGFGAVGQALARAFARNDIQVAVASRRPPEALLPQAQAIGSTVIPTTLQEAIRADVIFLAVLFEGHREVAGNLASWQGKTIVDAMNGFGMSSAVVAEAFPGARLVKGFNHLPARTLAADPHVEGGRRVVFLSSDDEAAAASVAALAEQLGFAPVKLGKLEEGGALVQARADRSWGPLIFQDLFRRES
ncbi:MAG: NAD(P)-binding domain-containing protein [Pseudomonadota bacterium]|nr:NAD(P)-binding domain-containing protein [Pseudomonadota bacterium]